MAEPVFMYTGADLAPRLAACVDRIGAELLSLSAELRVTAEPARAKALGHAIAEREQELRQSRIWLFESRRTPSHSWTLDIEQVRRLLGEAVYSQG